MSSPSFRSAFRLLIDLGVLAGTTFAGAALLAPFSTKADLVGQFLLQGAVFTAAMLIVTALRVDLVRSALLVVALIVQASVLRPDLPMPGAAADPGPSIRVLFANVLGRNQRHRDAIEAILRQDADVIVLAEFLRDWPASIEDLREHYPYRANCLSTIYCDVVILSRLPMSGPRSTPGDYVGAYVALGEVETPAGPVLVAGTHLQRPIPLGNLTRQMGQVRYLADHLPQAELPLVLAGDLNSVTWGRVVNRIEQETGLMVLHGLEGTWPSQFIWPLRLPIDHVFINDRFRVLGRRLINIPGSDHKAVVVDLAIRESDTAL